MTTDFYNGIHRTMVDRMKDPRCLIDAEALASHMSIVSLDPSEDKKPKLKGKKKKGESSMSNSKAENSSATGMK